MNKELLQKVERLVDEKYLSNELPHLDWTLIAWYILTSLEDHQAWMFRKAAEDESLTRNLETLVDRLKYSLKHALLRAKTESNCDSPHELPRAVIPTLYERATKIIQDGIEYNTAIQIISSVYDKKITLTKQGNTIEIKVLDEMYHDTSYSTLEMIGHIPPETITYSLSLYWWFKSPQSIPPIIYGIADEVSLRKRILRYEYNPYFAHELSRNLSQQPFLVPDNWSFDWGGRHETTLLLNALAIRCIYHIVAIEFGARKFSLSGGGHESLVLILTREQLIKDIAELSSIESEQIGLFVDNLTYGYRVKSPDPALQPLIKISKKRIAIPCFHLITSHLERNLLTLQARTAPKNFDSHSKLFEVDMIESMVSKINDKWQSTNNNFHATLSGITEELDLVIADESSKTIFVGELRWMLPPGDPREVQNKKKTCGEKVTQLRRKINWLNGNLNAFLSNTFNIKDENNSWEVFGAVIIEGFGGAKSFDPEIPILVKYIAEIGLLNCTSIRQFGEWSRSLEWLPKEGQHFDRGTDQIETTEESIKYSNAEILITPEEYRVHVANSIDIFRSNQASSQ